MYTILILKSSFNVPRMTLFCRHTEHQRNQQYLKIVNVCEHSTNFLELILIIFQVWHIVIVTIKAFNVDSMDVNRKIYKCTWQTQSFQTSYSTSIIMYHNFCGSSEIRLCVVAIKESSSFLRKNKNVLRNIIMWLFSQYWQSVMDS